MVKGRKKQQQRTFFILLAVAVCALLAVVLLLCKAAGERGVVRKLYNEGYVSLDSAMKAGGYRAVPVAQGSALRYENDLYEISFDYEAGKVFKDLFTFDFPKCFLFYNDDFFIDTKYLSSVIHKTIVTNYPDVTVEKIEHPMNAWVELSGGMIAHAGGAMRSEDVTMYTYVNNVTTLVQNYSLGHRVFEMDFNLTSDNRLAGTHDWEYAGFPDGAPTSAQWDDYLVQGLYPSSYIDDIYRAMMVNEDIYLIPDTKIYNRPREEIMEMYQVITDTAKKYDPALLDRIIPAFNTPEMHDAIVEVYPYKNMVYTLQATKTPFDDVIAYVKDKENVPVVLTPAHRYNPEFMQNLKEIDKKLYGYTVNDVSELAEKLRVGFSGVLTDYLQPSAISDLLIAQNG